MQTLPGAWGRASRAADSRVVTISAGVVWRVQSTSARGPDAVSLKVCT